MKIITNDEEKTKINKWNRFHRVNCPNYLEQGAIGGRLTYQMTPTGLGTIDKIVCVCGETLDLTTYNW